MMKRSAFSLCALLLSVAPMVQADDAVLKQQIEALQQRVSDLEKRLDALETPQIKQAIKEAVGPESPGDSKVASNWDFLKIGYGYDKVRELLGEPMNVKGGAMEFWFYSDRDMDGPYVKFLFNKVNGWKGPEAKK